MAALAPGNPREFKSLLKAPPLGARGNGEIREKNKTHIPGNKWNKRPM